MEVTGGYICGSVGKVKVVYVLVHTHASSMFTNVPDLCAVIHDIRDLYALSCCLFVVMRPCMPSPRVCLASCAAALDACNGMPFLVAPNRMLM